MPRLSPNVTESLLNCGVQAVLLVFCRIKALRVEILPTGGGEGVWHGVENAH